MLIETNEEIQLFIDLAVQFVTGKTLDFQMLAKAFNDRVIAAGPLTTHLGSK